MAWGLAVLLVWLNKTHPQWLTVDETNFWFKEDALTVLATAVLAALIGVVGTAFATYFIARDVARQVTKEASAQGDRTTAREQSFLRDQASRQGYSRLFEVLFESLHVHVEPLLEDTMTMQDFARRYIQQANGEDSSHSSSQTWVQDLPSDDDAMEINRAADRIYEVALIIQRLHNSLPDCELKRRALTDSECLFECMRRVRELGPLRTLMAGMKAQTAETTQERSHLAKEWNESLHVAAGSTHVAWVKGMNWSDSLQPLSVAALLVGSNLVAYLNCEAVAILDGLSLAPSPSVGHGDL